MSEESKPVLIGRQREREELTLARDSGNPELIAIYGRRRVGKTYLVRTFFVSELCLEVVGAREMTLAQQLRNFSDALSKVTGYRLQTPESWPVAFQELIRYLEEQLKQGRKVVFFDELPWLAGPRSGFLPAFEHFWNSWGSRQNNLAVVVCGSAASWMIAKVLHQKGGLHNRVTKTLAIQPFQLHETEEYLRARGIQLDRKQLMELTMAIGGIPYYLNYVRKGRSAAQNIDALFFAKGAALRDEFDKLFAALFEHYERHLRVIRALARKQSGLLRDEIVSATGLESGGNVTTILTELEASGFICRLVPLGRESREPIFRLVDELTLFHLRWGAGEGDGRWPRLRGTPSWAAWSGYAFENLCLKHVLQIKRALGISGIQADPSSWRHRAKTPDESGAQIDLLIDRRDGVINVCEMKFSENEFIIDKKYAAELRTKMEVFRRVSKTRKSLFLTLVTSFGIKANSYSEELVQNSITADALFEA
jgi:uncharacterized protein